MEIKIQKDTSFSFITLRFFMIRFLFPSCRQPDQTAMIISAAKTAIYVTFSAADPLFVSAAGLLSSDLIC